MSVRQSRVNTGVLFGAEPMVKMVNFLLAKANCKLSWKENCPIDWIESKLSGSLVEWEEEEERKGEETDQGGGEGEGEKGHKFEVITVCRGCKWPHK